MHSFSLFFNNYNYTIENSNFKYFKYIKDNCTSTMETTGFKIIRNCEYEYLMHLAIFGNNNIKYDNISKRFLDEFLQKIINLCYIFKIISVEKENIIQQDQYKDEIIPDEGLVNKIN